MPWLIGRKTDSQIVEFAGDSHWTLEKIQSSIVANNGGSIGDYSFYELTKTDCDKIRDRWTYSVNWASGEITGVDFSGETGKPWVKLYATKTFIANDGVDSTVITLEVWKPNLSGIADNIQRTAFRVTINTPDGDRFVRINIVNGIGVATFKTTKSGPYIFPADAKRYGTMRIFNQLKIDVDDLTLLTQ